MINEIASAIFAIALAAPPMLFPNRSPEFYALTILSAIAAYLAFWCIRLHQKMSKLTDALKELSEKNTALSSQFDKKRDQLNKYRAGFRSIEYMIACTMTTSRKDRFTTFYEWFCNVKGNLFEK